MKRAIIALLGVLAGVAAQPLRAERLEWPPQLAAAEPWPTTHIVPALGPFTTHQQVKVDGKAVPIEANVESLAFEQQGGKRDAIVSLTSYTRSDVERNLRPVIFAFNGGPGGSSIWVHLGFLGPKLLDVPADPTVPIPASGKLVPNPDSILDMADVVIIDMVGTGYGKLVNTDGDKYYYSTPGDGAYFANVIRYWLRTHKRSASPVFLLGESYGSVRAAVVAADLTCVQGGKGCEAVSLKGVALLSQVLAQPGQTLSRAMDMPSLAGIACYHRRVDCSGQSVEQFMAKAYDFAAKEYLPALFKADGMSEAERQEIARRLSSFTGLEPQFFLDNDFYVDREEYRGLLFKSSNQVVGRFDGRYLRLRTEQGPNDPSFDELNRALQAAANNLFSGDLGVVGAPPYSIFVHEPPFEWRYSRISVPWTNFNFYRYLDAASIRVPNLKVMMVGGLYDGAAGYGGDRYVLDHWKVRSQNLLYRHYDGGHMFYLVPASRRLFIADLRRFVAGALTAAEPTR